MYSQFIYGKFSSAENSGFRLIASTSDLKNNVQFTDMVQRRYYFWGSQGSRGGKAVGIFPFQDEKLILGKIQPAIDKNRQPLRSGSRPYYHHHYLLIPQSDINKLETHIVDILYKFLGKPSPYFVNFNQAAYPHDIPWEAMTGDLFEELPAKDLSQNIGDKIRICWNEKDQQNRSFLQLALETIANEKRFILTADKDVSSPSDFLENLLLLLPASCRTEIAIAIGSVDEQECTWANIIIKMKENPRRNIPEKIIWLNRSSQKVIGNYDSAVFDHQYPRDFIAPIYENPIAISNFIMHLNEQKDFSIQDLSDPKRLISLIPSLPEKYQLDLWCKYILEFYNYWQTTDSSQSIEVDSDWQLIITNYGSYQSFWQALLQLSEEKSKHLLITVPLILMVIGHSTLEKVGKKLDEVKENSKLAFNLVDAGLLDRFTPESLDNAIDKKLISTCYEGVKYIADNYLVHKSIQEFHKYSIQIEKSKNYQRLFPQLSQKFSLIDIALEKQLDPEIIKVIFNQKLFPKLPYKNKQFIYNSNLYRQLQQHFPKVEKSVNLLLQNGIKGVNYLPQIANVMEINYVQSDLIYIHFLKELDPPVNDAVPLLVDTIQKAINNDQVIPADDEICSNISSNFHPNNFSDKINNFPQTYQWFKNNSNELKQLLDSLETTPNNWQSWHKFVSFIYKEPLEQILFLDKTIENHFPKESLINWLTIIDKNHVFKEQFFKSTAWNKWNNLSSEIVINLLRDDYQKWIKIITHIFLAQFNLESKRLENIIPTLFHYFKVFYQDVTNITKEDQDLWIRLTEPMIFDLLCNTERLSLLPLKWKLFPEGVFPPPKQALNEEQQKHLYAIVKARFDNLSNFKTRLNLLCECHALGLNKDQHKKLAIDLIKICSSSQEVKDLIDSCHNFDFDITQKREVLKNANTQLGNPELFEIAKSLL